jgi:hypothetical protein
MAKFSIRRADFAWVVALFIIVLGSVAVTRLPSRNTLQSRHRPSSCATCRRFCAGA